MYHLFIKSWIFFWHVVSKKTIMILKLYTCFDVSLFICERKQKQRFMHCNYLYYRVNNRTDSSYIIFLSNDTRLMFYSEFYLLNDLDHLPTTRWPPRSWLNYLNVTRLSERNLKTVKSMKARLHKKLIRYNKKLFSYSIRN